MKSIPVRHIVSNHIPNSNLGRFSIRSLQQILKGKDQAHPLHKHDFYFLLAVSEGEGLHEIDFISYPIHKHSIFLLRPGQVHRLELSATSSGFLIEFDLSFYQPKNSISDHHWMQISGKNFCEVEALRFKKLQAYLACMFNEYSEKQEGYQEAIKANMDLFFIEYFRQSSNLANGSRAENSYMQKRFEAFIYHLETNIFSKKNVSQYATLLNLSAYQLNAITKASVGKTASELINGQIILEAKRHLLATPAQIKDIAYHLGYEDVSYFIRFFKKQTGQSPEAFRKNFK